MANVNLKTDFKDGEFLYADQLKNNFEAIQAALNAMNAIVWQDNADKVVTFRGTTEELMNREIIDGQILYDTTTGESYIDYKGKRISTGSGNAIHIGETEPTNPSTQIWIDKDELAGVGSEVVNSLEGNEERMAPSVAAVNKKGSFIRAGISTDFITNETGAQLIIPLDKIYDKMGDILSLSEDGGIKIGKNIKAIRISGQLYYYTGTATYRRTAYIYKGSVEQSAINYLETLSNYTSLQITDTYINVIEGDIIYLKFKGSQNDLIKYYANATYLNVEVIK